MICAPSYSENGGGTIWLHGLADALVALGEDAFVIPMEPLVRQSIKSQVKNLLKARNPFVQKHFCMMPRTRASLATRRDIDDDTIVVYPEIVPGNPLGAKNVVRWLLYKPGLACPFIPYSGEMYFAAGNFSDDPALTGGAPRLTYWKVHPAYRNKGYTDRSGSCYMLRKQRDKPIVHNLEDSVCLDGKSHTEIAEIFNRSEVFYCYDEMTMYAQFAPLCGCPTVVVSGFFSSHDEYVKCRPLARFGVSYGFDHIDHAKQTMHLVLDALNEKEDESKDTILEFIALTQKKFRCGGVLKW